MRLSTRLLVLGFILTLTALPAAAATTVTLQNGLNGYAGTTDTWLDKSSVRDNYGGGPELHIRWYDGRDDCALVRFDLTGRFPPGAAVIHASLSVYYEIAGSFQVDDAITIKPFRLQPDAGWDENVYNAQYGVGASYRYRDAAENHEWTGGAEGAWYDKIDDGNGTARIKRADGTPTGASPPSSWVSFDVTPSVIEWQGGAANNGFLLVATGLAGGGTTCYGIFSSRDESLSSFRPKLTIVFESPVESAGRTWGRIKSLYR
jgi:hypothetical protein